MELDMEKVLNEMVLMRKDLAEFKKQLFTILVVGIGFLALLATVLALFK